MWLYEHYENAMNKDLSQVELVNSLKILLPGEVIILIYSLQKMH